MKAWQVLSSEYLVKRRWLNLRVDRVQTARGLVLPEYHVIETSDWVCVVPITADDEYLMVRQYRHGVRRTTLEFPAGALDPGEQPLEAAKRELQEETGYEAEHWQHLLSVHPETTRHGHQAHLFLARGARQVAPQALDESEDVEVCLEPRRRRTQLVGEISHAVHVLALLLADAHE